MSILRETIGGPVDLGSVGWQSGRLSGQRWRRNDNGLVIFLHDVHRDEIYYNESTKAVGLLGFDFIANVALKVDYFNGSVEASVPNLFVPPADGLALQALLDDGVPFVTAQIGAS
jgi:hypothetical protein